MLRTNGSQRERVVCHGSCEGYVKRTLREKASALTMHCRNSREIVGDAKKSGCDRLRRAVKSEFRNFEIQNSECKYKRWKTKG